MPKTSPAGPLTTALIYSYIIMLTGPEKTGLIYTKYTYSYYGAYLFFCVCYPISVSFKFIGFSDYIKKFVLKCYVA